MITTVADMLQGFIEEEREKLNSYELDHGPTIGDMYEGLSVELLNRSIPQGLDLKIVDGFITDGANNLTGQMDCMLVQGDGEKIPYADSYKWHVKDVLVVFEVKKNLYSKNLIDSFMKLRQVTESYSKYIFEGVKRENYKIDFSTFYKTFSQITGISAPDYHDRHVLSKENELIYTTLLMEQLIPLRIVLGYNGFSTEYKLREKMVEFLESKEAETGFDITSFPQLIVCGSNSLVKINGRPYHSYSSNGYWDFMCSSRANPIKLILELIWTRLELSLEIKMPWGGDLTMEPFNRFLSAKPFFDKNQFIWHLDYHEATEKKLKKQLKAPDWQPLELTHIQYKVFFMLSCKEIDILSIDFKELLNNEVDSFDEFIKSMLSTGLLRLEGSILKLSTSEDLMLLNTPNGRYCVAESDSDRLNAWLSK